MIRLGTGPVRVAIMVLSVGLSGLLGFTLADTGLPGIALGVSDTLPPESEIQSPSAESELADGDLFAIQGTSRDEGGSEVQEVEVSTDGGESWQPAQPVEKSFRQWAYLWDSPPPGDYQIMAKAVDTAGNEEKPSKKVKVRVSDNWTTSYRIEDPYRGRGQYRKVQLHAHSSNSSDVDKAFSPEQVARAYRSQGYSFLVFTDHDVLTKQEDMNGPDFLALTGYESTGAGHISALFAKSHVNPSLPAQARIDGIDRDRGVAVMGHPDWSGYKWSAEELQTLRGYKAIEIYNTLTTEGRMERVQDNLEKWRLALNYKGPEDRVWGIAVSDSHNDRVDGGAFVMAKTRDVSEDALRDALVQGRHYATTGLILERVGVMEGQVAVTSTDATRIRFINQEGTVQREVNASRGTYRPQPEDRWIRAEAVDAGGRMAWTQPMWIFAN